MRDWQSWGAVGLVSLIWGAAFALVEIALPAGEPMALAFARVILALGVIGIAALVTGTRVPQGRAEWLGCGAMGFFSLAFPFVMLFWAQRSIDSSLAAAIIAMTPLFVLALARMVLGEQVQPRQWVGFSMGLLGLLGLIGPDALLDVFGAPPLAQLGVLCVTVSYAIGAITVKKVPPMPPITATLGSFSAATLMLAPFGAVSLTQSLPSAPQAALIALVILGILQTGLAQLLRYWAVKRAGPVFFSTVSYLIPLWAGLLGVFVLGETPDAWAYGGFGLILCGLLVARTKPQSDRPAEASKAG